jgi:UDP-N-acetylmuramyl-tripeptide synthetase/UDP-N-acetylmuramoyl-tripeptide--D-alanyl-D-alanine ligase
MAISLADLAGPLVPAGLERIEITGMTADSRQVQPGYLFAALPGVKADGARFISDAVKAGAAAILGPRSLPPGVAGYVPVLRVDDPRHELAKMAARFHSGQPDTVVGVTGTNGKTSVASFTRQIWKALGLSAASMGTTGISAPYGEEKLTHTTPDPIEMHRQLARMAFRGVTHLALEASSHGLMQRRLDGVRFAAAAFTNLSRDHLDYHHTFEDYFAAKMILFEELLSEGGVAVVNADSEHAAQVSKICVERGIRLMTVGRDGRDIRLLGQEREGFAQKLKLRFGGKIVDVRLPLVGEFQASNALVAAGLALATGGKVEQVMRALEKLTGARGRLEMVARVANGAPVFVDYSHTPDALENALGALRPYAANKLAVVFGAGGDRDPGKRSQMGEVAARLADLVYVSDDNPRSEDPAAIRAEIMKGCPEAVEVAGREEAIRRAMRELPPGSVLLVAGKGHETGQEIAGEVQPFSDHDVVLSAVGRAEAAVAMSEPEAKGLWAVKDLVAATGGQLHGIPREPLNGVSIDSRTCQKGDVFFAIKGENMDGHDYAAKALEAGAGVAVVSRSDDEMRAAGAVLEVDDTLRALEDLGRAGRARCGGQIIAVTGSVGKTSTKEALKLALSACGEAHASAASFNNQWGVPLTLARMPESAQFGVFEIGMNHAGEITPLTKMVRPHVAIVTTIAESHLGYFESLDEIAEAKAEIFTGLEPGGVAVINRDTPYFEMLDAAAKTAGAEVVISFGKHDEADVQLGKLVLHSSCSCVTARVFDEEVCFKLGTPGEHIAVNALAVLAAVKATGADLARATMALGDLQPAKGRGVRFKLPVEDGWLTLIDESYNANPTSMRAAIALLGQAKPGKGGRRIAVLGDMLELGEAASKLHKELSIPLQDAGVDAVYSCGAQMRHLHEALGEDMEKTHAPSSDALREPLLETLKAGDVVMVKGSLGSRMGPLVEAMRETFKSRHDEHGAEHEAEGAS